MSRFSGPAARRKRERDVHAFVAARFPAYPLYNIEAHLVQVAGRQQPVVLVGGLQPNLILGAAVGPSSFSTATKTPTSRPRLWPTCANSIDSGRSTGGGRGPINLFLDQIHAARHRWGDEAVIVPPFFWDTTGRATIHGIVTTAQKLIGERVFLEIADHSR
jgi:hypothetical protein